MHVSMVTYSFYENDNRVKRYAESLASLGDEVDVICLRKPGQPHFESRKGVRIYRAQRREKKERGKLSFVAKYALFFGVSFVLLSWLHFRHRYRIVHVHNPPDVLVFTALIPKLGGAKVLLDIHDIMPEFYRSKFSCPKDSLVYRLVLFAERMSARFADQVIVANHFWHSRYAARSAAPDKCTVIMNYPDSSIFYRRPKVQENKVFTFIYPGSLNFHQGLDVAIRALWILSKSHQNFQFRIFGSGAITELVALVASLGLEDKIHFYAPLPLEEIVNEVVAADCGLVPKRTSGFGGEAFSTKILEFMSLGIPVVVSDTTIDRHYFNDSVVLFFKSEDAEDLSGKLERIIHDASLRSSLIDCGLEFSKSYSWDVNKGVYFSLIRKVLLGKCLPKIQMDDEGSRLNDISRN